MAIFLIFIISALLSMRLVYNIVRETPLCIFDAFLICAFAVFGDKIILLFPL